MAVNLETLVLELKVNNKQFKKDIEKAVSDAKKDLKGLETVELGKKEPLSVNVDHSSLMALNEHLEEKKSHLDDVQKYFNENPIIPKQSSSGSVDAKTESGKGAGLNRETVNILKEQNKNIKKQNKLLEKNNEILNSKSNANQQFVTRNIDSSPKTNHSDKYWNSLRSVLQSVVVNVDEKKGPLESIKQGFLEGLGNPIGMSLSSGVQEAAQTQLGFSVEDFSNKIVQQFISTSKKLAGPTFEAIKESGKEVFGEAYLGFNKNFIDSIESEGDISKAIDEGIKSAFSDVAKALGNQIVQSSNFKPFKEGFSQAADDVPGVKTIKEIYKILSNEQKDRSIKSGNKFIQAIRELQLEGGKNYNNPNEEAREKEASLRKLFDESFIQDVKSRARKNRVIPLVLQRAKEISQQETKSDDEINEEINQARTKSKKQLKKGNTERAAAVFQSKKNNLVKKDTPDLVTEDTEHLVISTSGFTSRYKFPENDTGDRIAAELMALDDNTVGKGIKNIDTSLQESLSDVPEEQFGIEKAFSKDAQMLSVWSEAKPLLRGYSEDAVEMAAQAVAAKAKNPNIKITFAGESGGGLTAAEATQIMNELGYGDTVQGVGTGTPKEDIHENPSNATKFLSPHESIGRLSHDMKAYMGEDISEPEQNIEDVGGHLWEYYYYASKDVEKSFKPKQSVNDIFAEMKEIYKNLIQDNNIVEDFDAFERNKKEIQKHKKRVEEIKQTGVDTTEIEEQIRQLEVFNRDKVTDTDALEGSIEDEDLFSMEAFKKQAEHLKGEPGASKKIQSLLNKLDSEVDKYANIVENVKKSSFISDIPEKVIKDFESINKDLKKNRDKIHEAVSKTVEEIKEEEKKGEKEEEERIQREEEERIQKEEEERIQKQQKEKRFKELPDHRDISKNIAPPPIPNVPDNVPDPWDYETDPESLKNRLGSKEYTVKGLKKLAKERLDFPSKEIDPLKKQEIVEKIVNERDIQDIQSELDILGDSIRSKSHQKGQPSQLNEASENYAKTIRDVLRKQIQLINNSYQEYLKLQGEEKEEFGKHLKNSIANHLREIAKIEKQSTLDPSTRKSVGGYKGNLQQTLGELDKDIPQQPVNLSSKTEQGNKSQSTSLTNEDFLNKSVVMKHWKETEQYIYDVLRALVSKSDKEGYKIQRNIAEGTPGTTEEVRGFWGITGDFIKKQLVMIVSAAQTAGKKILNAFKNVFEYLQKGFSTTTKHIQSIWENITFNKSKKEQSEENPKDDIQQKYEDFKEKTKNSVQQKYEDFKEKARNAAPESKEESEIKQSDQQQKDENSTENLIKQKYEELVEKTKNASPKRFDPKKGIAFDFNEDSWEKTKRDIISNLAELKDDTQKKIENMNKKEIPWYDLLGVYKDTDYETLKRAYDELVKKYHPKFAKDGGDKKYMESINKAFNLGSTKVEQPKEEQNKTQQEQQKQSNKKGKKKEKHIPWNEILEVPKDINYESLAEAYSKLIAKYKDNKKYIESLNKAFEIGKQEIEKKTGNTQKETNKKAKPVPWNEILGVSSNIDLEELKNTYKELSKTYHPDVPETGDKKQFELINQAYEVGKQQIEKRKNKKKGMFGGGFPFGNPFGKKKKNKTKETSTEKETSEDDNTQKESPIEIGKNLIFENDEILKIKNYWQNTSEFIENSLKELKDTAKNEGYKIQKSLSEGSDGITFRMRGFWDNTVKFIINRVKDLTKSLKDLGNSISNVFKDIANSIKDVFNTAASDKAVNNKALPSSDSHSIVDSNSIESEETKEISDFEYIIELIRRKIKDSWNETTSRIRDFWDNTVKFIINRVKNLAKYLKAIGNSIYNIFKDIGNSINSIFNTTSDKAVNDKTLPSSDSHSIVDPNSIELEEISTFEYIIESIKTKIKNSWQLTATFIKNISKNLADALNVIGYKIQKSLSEGSDGTTFRIRGFWDNTVDFIINRVKDLATSLKNLGSSIYNVFKDVANSIKDIFNRPDDKTYNVQKTLPSTDIVDSSSMELEEISTFEYIIESIKTKIKNSWKLTTNFIKNISKSLANAIKAIGYKIQKSLSEGSDGITFRMRGFWDNTVKFIINRVKDLAKSLKNLGKLIYNTFKNIANSIKGVFNKTYKTYKIYDEQETPSSSDSGSIVDSNSINYTGEIPEISNLKYIKELIKTKIGKSWNETTFRIKKLWSNTVKFIINGIKTLAKYLKAFGNSMYNVFKAIGNSISNAIKSGKDSINNKVKNPTKKTETDSQKQSEEKEQDNETGSTLVNDYGEPVEKPRGPDPENEDENEDIFNSLKDLFNRLEKPRIIDPEDEDENEDETNNIIDTLENLFDSLVKSRDPEDKNKNKDDKDENRDDENDDLFNTIKDLFTNNREIRDPWDAKNTKKYSDYNILDSINNQDDSNSITNNIPDPWIKPEKESISEYNLRMLREADREYSKNPSKPLTEIMQKIAARESKKAKITKPTNKDKNTDWGTKKDEIRDNIYDLPSILETIGYKTQNHPIEAYDSQEKVKRKIKYVPVDFTDFTEKSKITSNSDYQKKNKTKFHQKTKEVKSNKTDSETKENKKSIFERGNILKIKDYWQNTKEFIENSLKELKDTAKNQGYKIQKSLSEGSDGTTSRMRGFWDNTVGFIINRIKDLTKVAGKAGKLIYHALTDPFVILKNMTVSLASIFVDDENKKSNNAKTEKEKEKIEVDNEVKKAYRRSKELDDLIDGLTGRNDGNFEEIIPDSETTNKKANSSNTRFGFFSELKIRAENIVKDLLQFVNNTKNSIKKAYGKALDGSLFQEFADGIKETLREEHRKFKNYMEFDFDNPDTEKNYSSASEYIQDALNDFLNRAEKIWDESEKSDFQKTVEEGTIKAQDDDEKVRKNRREYNEFDELGFNIRDDKRIDNIPDLSNISDIDDIPDGNVNDKYNNSSQDRRNKLEREILDYLKDVNFSEMRKRIEALKLEDIYNAPSKNLPRNTKIAKDERPEFHKEIRKDESKNKKKPPFKVNNINPIDAIGNSLKVLGKITQKVEKHWNNTTKKIHNYVYGLSISINELGYKIQKGISEGSDGITDKIRGFWDHTINFIKDRVLNLKNFINNIGSSISNAFATIFKGILGETIYQKIKNILKTIKKFFGYLKSRWREAVTGYSEDYIQAAAAVYRPRQKEAWEEFDNMMNTAYNKQVFQNFVNESEIKAFDDDEKVQENRAKYGENTDPHYRDIDNLGRMEDRSNLTDKDINNKFDEFIKSQNTQDNLEKEILDYIRDDNLSKIRAQLEKLNLEDILKKTLPQETKIAKNEHPGFPKEQRKNISVVSQNKQPSLNKDSKELKVLGENSVEVEEKWNQTTKKIYKYVFGLSLNLKKLGYKIQTYLSEGSPGITKRIRKFWGKTTKKIYKDIFGLSSDAKKLGYKIQKSLSEGSDGTTSRTRGFWGRTAKYLKNKIGSIKDKASKTGSSIQKSFRSPGASIRNLVNQISSVSTSLQDVQNSASQSLENIKNRFKNFDLVEFITNTFIATQIFDFFENFTENVIEFSKASVQAYNELQSLKSGLSFAFAKDADRIISDISDKANELGLNFDVVAESYKEFGAAVKGTKLSTEVEGIMEGFQTASAALGLNKEKQKSVFTALSQMASKGVISAEELRQQMGEHLPIAIQASARAMGMSIKQFNKMLESGNLLAEDLLPKLAKQLKLETQDQAKKKAESFRASLNRLKNEIGSLQAGVGEFVSNSIKPLINQLVNIVQLLNEKKGVLISVISGALIGGLSILADRFKLVYDSINVLTKGLSQISGSGALLTKTKNIVKGVGKSLLKFTGITAGVAAAGITLMTIYKQLNAHQTKFDDYTKSSIQSLNEFRKELGKTNNTELDISKQFKLGDTRDIFDSAINFMNKIDRMANRQVAKVTPFSEEQLNADLKTNAQVKAEHIRVDATESLDATGKLIDDYANQINNDEEMDKMISALQSNTKEQQQVEAALIRNEGDTNKEEELLNKQKDLVKEREDIINKFVPGGEEQLNKEIKQLKKQISLMKELNGQQLGGGKEFKLDNHIERANLQLEQMQNLSDDFATKMELANREVKDLKSSFQDINAEMQNKEFNLDAAIPQAKKKVNEQFLAGNINEKEREQILEKIEIEHQDKRLQYLQQYQKEYKKTFEDLNTAERAQIKNLLDGKSLKDAQIGTIEKGIQDSENKSVSTNVTTALKKRAEMIKRSKEIDNLQLEISEKQVEQHKEAEENQKELKDKKEKLKSNREELKEKIKSFKDKVEQFQKEQKQIVKEHNNLTDDFREKLKDFYKSTNKNLIQASKKLKETKKQNKKLEIDNSLKEIHGNVSDLFGDFSNVISESILNQKKFQTDKEEKELTRLEAEEKTAEIAQKIKDFQDERSEIVKRGNELRKKYLENEAEFQKTKVEHQNAVAKLQTQIQKQIQEIGKGFNSVAHGVAKEGNKILSALSQLGNNLNSANVSSGSSGTIPKGAENIADALYESIIGKESGGNHKAVNKDTGALGLGQVMPGNVAAWTEHALGRVFNPQEFLNNKEAQIKTIKNKLKQYYMEALEESGGDRKEAIRRVASKWYSGQGDLFNHNGSEGDYPTIREYTLDILDRVKKYSGNSIGQSIQTAAEDVVFPIPGRNANQNLPGAGGMMDAVRHRGNGAEKHNGIDYIYGTGTPLQSPISGTVSSVYSDKGEYGVKVRGKDEQGRSIEVALNHLHSIAQNIQQGQQLQAGQKIGTVGGDKGSWGSSGAHLDLKIKVNGNYVDPRNFFGNKSSSEVSVEPDQTNQQNTPQISTPDYEPIKIDENIPEFEEINLPDLSGLGNIQQERTEAVQAQSEEDIRKIELEERKEQLETENKRHSLQNKIKDSIRETQREITESRKETENIIRGNQTVLSNEEELLEKREEITSNFEDAVRSRKDEAREIKRTLKTEKGRIEILEQEIELMEDGEEKQKNIKQLELLKESMKTRQNQLNSLKEEITLLENNKANAIKANLDLKRRELELDKRKYTSGIKKDLIDSQVGVLSSENKNDYKKAELQAEASLMQERLRHSEKILDIEKNIKDQQERQKLIELENQTHENKLQRIRAEKQEKIEQANKKKQDLKTKYKTNLIDTQASTLEYSPYKQAELEGQSKIIQHKASTQQKKEDLEEQIKLLNLNAKEAEKLRTQFKKINQIKLNKIKQESNLLLNQVKDITRKGFSNLFESFGKVIQGSKSMGEAFRGFATTVLKSIAKIATKNLTSAVMGGIFGGGAVSGGIGGSGGGIASAISGGGASGGIGGFIGNAVSSLFNSGGKVENFAKGGNVDKAFGDSFSQIEDYLDSENIDEIRNTAKGKFKNFAGGGAIDSNNFGSNISDTKKYLGSDNLKIENMATGGLIEALKKERKEGGGQPVPIVASVGEQVLSAKNGDAQFFRHIQKKGIWARLKEAPIPKINNFNNGGTVDSGFNDNLQRKMRWSENPAVSTFNSSEKLNNTQNKSISEDRSINVSSPITVVSPTPEKYRKTQNQIAKEQENKTKRAYRRFN